MNYQLNLYAWLVVAYTIIIGDIKNILEELGNIVRACAETCEGQDIISNESCANKGGLNCGFYTCSTNIDWEATAGQYDEATCTLSGFVMMGGAVFNTLKFAKKSGSYDFTYTSSDQAYNLLINMIFEGKSAENTKAFCKLVESCNFTLVLFDRNCTGRVVGKEWNEGLFEDLVDTLEIDRHLDSSGNYGGDKPRDEIDFAGQSDCPPIFHDFVKADFEAAYL